MEPDGGGDGGGGGSESRLGFGLLRSQSQFGVSPPNIPAPPLTVDAVTDSQQVEAASPISSRPPAPSSLNFEELVRISTGQIPADDDALAGDDADRTGGGGSRWPRQETLALIKIRSDMDSTFRDATLKGPLWDEISKKLTEMGYNRSAKKCKEKFENVQKYYKRTKEGRGGRQDGKTYKFFTELEALHKATPAVTTTATAQTGFTISNPTPISTVKIFSPADNFTVRPPPVAAQTGVSISSNTSSASTEDDEDDEEEMGFDVERSSVGGSSRKRRREVVEGSGSRTHKMMMEFFEGLMKRVMDKQEVMQQKFLESIEKRERDRMIREEKWKSEEMDRLNREKEVMAQERTISSSRDSAIIAFLQKFTGQTIQLPLVDINSPVCAAPPPQQQQHDVPVSVSVPMSVAVSVPLPLSAVPTQPQQQQNQIIGTQVQNQAMPSLETSQGGGDGDGSLDPISSRWPKPEVLALIKLRSGLESRYQEACPKGPLWEQISAEMQQMGYKRNPKRCKEKWENINKYYKKVKESNKKRRDGSKTCPYFDELDALYRKKILGDGGGSGSRSSFSDTSKFDHDHPIQPQPQSQTTTLAEGLSASLFGEGSDEQQPEKSTKPEDIVNELMELQDLYRPGRNDVDRDENNEEDHCSDGEDDDTQDEKRNNKNQMDYKIEFQRRTVGNSNGVKSDFQSMAVVQ